MDEVEEVEVEVFRNIWARKDIFRSEVGEGEEGPAEPAACAGGGGEETRDHRPQKSREDVNDGEGAGREEEPPETVQLSRSGRKMRKRSCSCCK